MSSHEFFLTLFALTGTFGWIPLLIHYKHKYRIEELRSRAGLTQESVHELRALRQEVERLRDTSTKFDVAFDAALTRLEERVDGVESNSPSVTPASAVPSRTYNAEPAPKTVSVGRQQWM